MPSPSSKRDWNEYIKQSVRKSCLVQAWIPVRNCIPGAKVRLIMANLNDYFRNTMKSGFNPSQRVYIWPSTKTEVDNIKQRRDAILAGSQTKLQTDTYVSIAHDDEGMDKIQYKIIDGAHRCKWLRDNMETCGEKEVEELSFEMTHVFAMILDPASLDTVVLAYAFNQKTHESVPLAETGMLQAMARYLEVRPL